MRFCIPPFLSAVLLSGAALASNPPVTAPPVAASKPEQQTAAVSPASAASVPAQATDPAASLYQVEEGNKVDPVTLQGWKTWRAMACERCHGPAQEGLVGPALVESLKKLTKEQFYETITKGRVEKGMPPFGGVETVTKNWEGLYAYLKGRSDGKILPGRLTAIEPH
jgi:mono/diheme cytochrome c family protein